MYTKKTIATWADQDPWRQSEQFRIERAAMVEKMVEQQKTDGEPIFEAGNDLVVTRMWVDQAAAEEWKAFLEKAVTDHGASVTVVIADAGPV